MVPRVDTAPHGVETPTPLADQLGYVKSAVPGEYTVPSPKPKSFIYLQLQLLGDESGYPPGQYRPVRLETPCAGTPLLARVREAGGPTHWGQEGSASSLSMI